MLILGAMSWVPQWLSPGGTLTEEQVADAFADRLLHGQLKPSKRARTKPEKTS